MEESESNFRDEIKQLKKESEMKHNESIKLIEEKKDEQIMELTNQIQDMSSLNEQLKIEIDEFIQSNEAM